MINNEWKGLPIVIIGQGGLGKKIEATIKEINKFSKNNVYNFVGYLDDNEGLKETKNRLGKIEKLEELSQKKLIGVVIAIGNPSIKKMIYDRIKNYSNLCFPNIVHPNSFMYDDLKIGIGNIITSGVNICTSVRIGNFNLLNLSCTIGHDVKISSYCIINPLASISGNTNLKDEILVGTGANILQNLTIERKCIIGAGALISKNCLSEKTYIGIPGKEKK